MRARVRLILIEVDIFLCEQFDADIVERCLRHVEHARIEHASEAVQTLVVWMLCNEEVARVVLHAFHILVRCFITEQGYMIVVWLFRTEEVAHEVN